MEQQTAVEWLGYELNTKLFYNISSELWVEVNKIFEQAKQMEKMHIERAYTNGASDGVLNKFEGSEAYYNKTHTK